MHWARAKDSNTWHVFSGPKAEASKCGNLLAKDADHPIIKLSQASVAAAGGFCCLTCRERSKDRTFTASFVDHYSELRSRPERDDLKPVIENLREFCSGFAVPALKTEEMPPSVRAPLRPLAVFRLFQEPSTQTDGKITVHFLKKRDK